MAGRDFDIRVNDRGTLRRVREQMLRMPEGVERAQRRAMTKLKRWLERQVLRAAAEAAGVPQKRLKVLLRFSARRRDGGLVLWVGTNPIAAHDLGAVRWTRRMRGARAGRRSFPGTWSWVAKPGAATGPLIMKRTGEERVMRSGRYAGKVREAIDRVEVPIHAPVEQAIERLMPEISRRYETLMLQELRYALEIESRRGGA